MTPRRDHRSTALVCVRPPVRCPIFRGEPDVLFGRGARRAVFGLGLEATGEPVLTAVQASLIEAREEARRRKDWSTADRLRAELLAQGIPAAFWGNPDTTVGPSVS